MEPVRVRFAPSPTGELHIGGLRTALYDWLLARKTGGAFIVRIEDTDQTRLVEGAETRLLTLLKTYGLDYDEGPDCGGPYGPYRQSERLGLYQEHAGILVRKGQAYYCTCTPDRLERLREEQQGRGEAPRYDGHCREQYKERPSEPFVIRMRIPESRTVSGNDAIRGSVQFNSATLDDFVILKTDGFPTYHLAVVVDDELMKITHTIRGEEWLPSLPKHVLLYEAFGWEPPVFVHLPLIVGVDRQKLSKRQGATSAQVFLDEGFLPEAVINFIALLGWHSSGNQERYTLKDLIDAFSLDRIQRAPAAFDRNKLDWLNATIIRGLSDAQLADRARPFVESSLKPEYQQRLPEALRLVKARVERLTQLPELLRFLSVEHAVDPAILPYKNALVEETRDALLFSEKLLTEYQGDWSAKKLEVFCLDEIQKAGKTNGGILWPLRVALTGQKASPGNFEVLEFLGREESLTRIHEALGLLE
jgi:glutamyl-tRNA synthetase